MNIFGKIKNRFMGGGVRPNVVIILLDQFRNDARDVHPVFQMLADEGTLFSQTITYAPYTLASCHAIFTGIYGCRTGVNAYTKSDRFDDRNCFTIAQYLKTAGYTTYAYTFSSILIPHGGIDHLTIVPETEEKDIRQSHFRELERCFSGNKPFFSYLHFGEIHHNVVREVIKKFSIDDERYFGHMDENSRRYRKFAWEAGEYLSAVVGRIRELDREDNTLVIVLTDHGASNGERAGEKAYGTFIYDYSIKIWHYWVYPKVFPKGFEISQQVRTVDILPTLLDLLDIKPRKGKLPADGSSLLPLIRGEKDSAERISFSETGGVDGAYPSPDCPNVRCVRDGRWKLIQNITTNQFELYDTVADPAEKNNLYQDRAVDAQRLWQKMIQYL